MSRFVLLPTLVFVLLGPAVGAAAQADSAAASRAAREAQARFERDRRGLLPVTRANGAGGSCDEELGRICLRLGESSDWWPGPEPDGLVEAREVLLSAFAAAAVAAGGDPWLLGQRVFYLGEAGRWDQALALATACGLADGVWWCDALRGLALHELSRYPPAERAFAQALDRMPPDEADGWRDPSPLFDGEGRSFWGSLDQEQRAAEAERLWAYADPLFLVSGNDRWTAHLARRTMARIRTDARNGYGLVWGRDLEELLIRYGWERGWERQEVSGSIIGEPLGSIIGHHHPYTRPFVPPGRAWREPGGAEANAWNPGSRPEARTGYAPAYAPVLLPAEAQIAVLPRGDRVVVAGAISLPSDTTYHALHEHERLPGPADVRARPDESGLFLLTLDGAELHAARGSAGKDALLLEAPAGDYLLSMEVWSPTLGRAGRIRRSVRAPPVPRDVPTLSDLLVAHATEPDPASAEELLPNLLTELAADPGDTLRVGWELHGLGWRDETVRYRLELSAGAGGVLRRAGRWLRLVGEPDRVALEWEEQGPSQPGVLFRSVLLALPPALNAGVHRLRLEVSTAGRTVIMSDRELLVRAARR